jgi:hypothetical protein
MRMWEISGIELVPPADAREIQAVMDQIGHKASADVMQLYQFTGGFASDSDNDLWSLWSLDRIRQDNLKVTRPRWAFADGLIDSFLFCFQYENELVSSVWVDHCAPDAFYQKASSVAEVFALYLSDPTDLLLG